MKKFDLDVLKNGALTREDIEHALTADLKAVFIFCQELLNSKACIDALTNVYWERYQAFHKAKEEQPELPLDGKEAQDGV